MHIATMRMLWLLPLLALPVYTTSDYPAARILENDVPLRVRPRATSTITFVPGSLLLPIITKTTSSSSQAASHSATLLMPIASSSAAATTKPIALSDLTSQQQNGNSSWGSDLVQPASATLSHYRRTHSDILFRYKNGSQITRQTRTVCRGDLSAAQTRIRTRRSQILASPGMSSTSVKYNECD